MKAVLFDLDDTLYSEIDFVKSGFRVVAKHLNQRYTFDEYDIYNKAIEILTEDGRGKVFDTLMKNLNLYTQERIRLLVYLYRAHHPNIQLFAGAVPLIEKLRQNGMRLGVITDGMASVQRNKVLALGLDKLVDTIIYTDELGKEHWKPSVLPFKIALELLNVPPHEAVYVGDDVSKDFVGPNSIGMHTIQVKRQKQQDLIAKEKDDPYNAKTIINNLDEISSIILKSVENEIYNN